MSCIVFCYPIVATRNSVEREGADEMCRYVSVFSMGLEGDRRGQADQQEGGSGIFLSNPSNRKG